MFRIGCCSIVLVLLSGVTNAARAAVPPPKDEAGFFGADALKMAATRMESFETKYQLPILIETFPAIPEEKKKDVDLLDVRARERLFADWGRERLQAQNLDGVAIVICKDPGYIFVALGEKTRQTRLTPSDRRGLVSLMINRFVDRRFDDALLGGLEFIEERVQANLQKPPAELPSADDDIGAGGEATPVNVFGLRARVMGAGLRGIRDVTPPPPPAQTEAADTGADPDKEASLSDSVGMWLLVVAGGALILALVLVGIRWARRSPSPAAPQPAGKDY